LYNIVPYVYIIKKRVKGEMKEMGKEGRGVEKKGRKEK